MGKTYANCKSRHLGPLVQHKSVALASHWFFQSTLYMDTTERLWKFGLDVLLTAILAGLLRGHMRRLPLIAVAWCGAHTFNFFFNAHFWSLTKHFGSINQDWLAYQSELIRLQQRIGREPNILFAAAYGSLARARWSPHSDLDVRLVRAPGILSACCVCWFATYERARAFLCRFPLDLYVLDSYSSLAQLSECSQPIVLGGSDGLSMDDRIKAHGTHHE